MENRHFAHKIKTFLSASQTPYSPVNIRSRCHSR
jgi:hypothetical protein